MKLKYGEEKNNVEFLSQLAPKKTQVFNKELASIKMMIVQKSCINNFLFGLLVAGIKQKNGHKLF